MTDYYDYVLGLIPVALFGISAALSVVGISLTTAVPLAASVAVLVVGHALFVNGPVETPTDDRTPAHRPLNAD